MEAKELNSDDAQAVAVFLEPFWVYTKPKPLTDDLIAAKEVNLFDFFPSTLVTKRRVPVQHS